LLYGTRLLILGIGVGVIAGTSLSIFDPASHRSAETPQPEQTAPSPQSSPTLPLELTQEIQALKTQIQSAIASQTQLTPGLMIVDADTRAFLEINGSNAIPAASTIKFPILVAFFQAVDEGTIRLDQPLTLKKEQIATESGELQDFPVGSQFPAIQVATKMIDISDNTATNMIIDLLGGKDAVNQRFQSWGLTSTAIQNPLPDLQGTNTSSPRDMVTLLSAVNGGKLVSMRSHERMLDIMRKVVNNSLLPQGLGEGAVIAHKTGDIGAMLGDVGIIDLPNGKRYLIAAMVKRPHNDERAADSIRKMSELAYQYFSQRAGTVPPNPEGTPSASPSANPSVNPQGAEPSNRSTIAQP
jgi:beta-lactamase class A